MRLVYLYVQLTIKFLHESYVIKRITYVLSVHLDQEFMSFPVAYPFQQPLIPLGPYFLWIRRVHRGAIANDSILRLVYVVRQHHLVHHHVLQGGPLLSRTRLYHLLLYYQLLLSR